MGDPIETRRNSGDYERNSGDYDGDILSLEATPNYNRKIRDHGRDQIEATRSSNISDCQEKWSTKAAVQKPDY